MPLRLSISLVGGKELNITSLSASYRRCCQYSIYSSSTALTEGNHSRRMTSSQLFFGNSIVKHIFDSLQMMIVDQLIVIFLRVLASILLATKIKGVKM